jgi:oligoendopeptidase F
MNREPVKRDEVPREDTWDLTAMYTDTEEWERDLSDAARLPEALALHRGQASRSPEGMLAAVKAILDANRRAEKILTYAHMVHDQDLSDTAGSVMFQKAMDLITSLNTSTSWFNPEVLSVPEDTIRSWLKAPPLSEYGTWLTDILRNRPHILSAGEEKILALAADATRGFGGAFGKLSNIEIPARFPQVTDSNGKNTRITHANFVPMLQSPDSRLREAVFKGFYEEIAGNTETLAALLDGQVRTNIFRARARSYPSALDASLFDDRVNAAVYRALIDAVHKNLPLMHRYYRMKKKAMNLDDLRIWDVYTPTVPDADAQYDIHQAQELTLKAVEPLGADYVTVLSRGFCDRWVDRYENIGKRSGAYSGGCYDSPPYMLLNFTGNLDSVFTLAHEAGHSMHSWLSRKHQPYHASEYRILLAEVASITNEMLLASHLMKESNSSRLSAYLLDSQINDFRSTLFRQAMFAEFELLIHERVEKGGSLSRHWLNETYLELVRSYHGDAFSLQGEEELIACEWARIPHFYYNFYVYKYATGMASAASISGRILSGDKSAVKRYMAFLSSGSSAPPLELLAEAGIDLQTPQPVNDAMKMLEGLVVRLEELIEN